MGLGKNLICGEIILQLEKSSLTLALNQGARRGSAGELQ